jgi:hypothetical protein
VKTPVGYFTMPRNLSEKDIALLKKLAPECGELACSGSGHMFHSILPPVSNHFSEDTDDFIRRIRHLSDEELVYLTDLISKGEESLGCLPEEDVQAFTQLIHDRLSPEDARKVVTAFEGSGRCEK